MGAVDKHRSTIVRVLIVDDNPVFLTILKQFLGQHPEFQIVDEAHDGDSALILAQHLCPDVILLDLQMPGVSGLEIIAPLRMMLPDVRIVVLSLFDWQQLTHVLGGHAYVSKTRLVDDLLPAIEQALQSNGTVAATAKPLDRLRE